MITALRSGNLAGPLMQVTASLPTMRTRFVSAVALFMLPCVLLAGCATPRAPLAGSAPERPGNQPAPPVRLMAVIMGDPSNFGGTVATSRGAGSVPGQTEIQDMLMAGLANVDNHGELRPELAKSLPTIANGGWTIEPDGRMTTTWTIRDGAVWHDGAPFTTADLEFVARVARERKVPQLRLDDPAWAMIDEIVAPDPRTITVRWNQPYLHADAMFTSIRAMPMPRHLLEPAYLADPGSFGDLPYWGQEFIGTGAFRLQELVSGSHLVLRANDQFVLGRPKIDEIWVNFVPDANALITNILAGTAQLTLGARISMAQALQVRDHWPDGRVEFAPTTLLALYPQLLNPDPPVLSDVRMRRALLELLDRQQMMEAMAAGMTVVADSTLSPNQADFADVQSAVVHYPFDTAAASQLIAELGYTKGTDGLYQDARGGRLKMDVRATAQNDYHPPAVASVSDAWQRAGIAVDQLMIPAQRVADLEYRHTRPGFEILALPNDPEYFQIFRSTQAPLPTNNFVGLNRSRYMNPAYDRLLDQYFASIPRPERLEVLRQIMHQLSDQLVIMPLFYTTTHTIIGNRVKNVTQRGPNATDAWNSEQWELQ
jgi:peptide/nickel transport system substrate-binding protein